MGLFILFGLFLFRTPEIERSKEALLLFTVFTPVCCVRRRSEVSDFDRRMGHSTGLTKEKSNRNFEIRLLIEQNTRYPIQLGGLITHVDTPTHLGREFAPVLHAGL